MYDCLGRELNVGDHVIISPSNRDALCLAQIIEFSSHNIYLKYTANNRGASVDQVENTYLIKTILPGHAVCLISHSEVVEYKLKTTIPT